MGSRDLSSPGNHKPGKLSQDINCQGGTDPDEAWDKRQLSSHSKEGRKDSNFEGASSSQEKALDLVEEETDIEEDEPESENLMDIFADFLEKFPAEKEEIEKCIRCILEEAGKIDETHKGCTIANITASSAGATSGILTILGLALAPVTAGGTLILTATGIGLGAAAGITGISTNISEGIIKSQKNKEAQKLINECEIKLNMLISQTDLKLTLHAKNNDIQEIIQHLALGGTQGVPKIVNAVKDITTNIKALQCAKGNAALKALAKQAAAKGSAARAALNGVEQVEGAFKGTALAMSKGARIFGTVFTASFLLLDAYSIAKDAIHLHQGAKTETASEIRKRASELEDELDKLNKLYENLRETLCMGENDED